MIRIVLLFALYAVVAAFRSVPVNRIVTTRVNLFGNNEPSRDNGNMPAKKDGGLFGGMGNLMESMKKAQEIAKQAEVMNKELSSQVVQVKALSFTIRIRYGLMELCVWCLGD